MLNDKLLHFRNKLNGLIFIYISIGLSAMYLIGYFLSISSSQFQQLSIIEGYISISSQIEPSIIPMIFIIGSFLIISSREKLEDEMVVEIRGKVAFQSFKLFLYTISFLLFVATFSKLSQNIMLILSLNALIANNYIFKFYSSLKFSDTKASPFSILPSWPPTALILIALSSFILSLLLGESFTTYLPIPAILCLGILGYAFYKLSFYIFQKAG